MTMQELFNHYRHYGIIEKRDDFEFNDDNISCGVSNFFD